MTKTLEALPTTPSHKPSPILRYFKYDHLREGPLKEASRPFCELAQIIEASCPDGPEKSAGLRKLLEAKDCVVRAWLPAEG